MNRGPFVGLCYLCGIPCGYTYCREHQWAADQLALPYRRDTLAWSSPQEAGHLIELLEKSERKLNAYRERDKAAA